MAGTFSQIYIQTVFAVKNRDALIQPEWESELYKYITGIVQNKGQKILAINGTSNHIHIFIGIKPTCCLSDLIREIKKSSNTFIKEKRFTHYNFQWLEGYSAFSYSHSALNQVIQYIQNQKEHHKKKTFKEEYMDFLKNLTLNLMTIIYSIGLMNKINIKYRQSAMRAHHTTPKESNDDGHDFATNMRPLRGHLY